MSKVPHESHGALTTVHFHTNIQHYIGIALKNWLALGHLQLRFAKDHYKEVCKMP